MASYENFVSKESSGTGCVPEGEHLQAPPGTQPELGAHGTETCCWEISQTQDVEFCIQFSFDAESVAGLLWD